MARHGSDDYVAELEEKVAELEEDIARYHRQIGKLVSQASNLRRTVKEASEHRRAVKDAARGPDNFTKEELLTAIRKRMR